MYNVEVTPKCRRELKKLDPYIQKMILAWIRKNLVGCDDPRIQGKALKGVYAGLWRYRIGDYRIICEINDDKLIILTLTVGHRSSVYLKENSSQEKY